MLSLMDPVELNDLVVFRDDDDPRKFYLLPDQPQISVDERGEPEFLFLKFIKDLDTLDEGEEASGGYIHLRTTLNIAPERRQRVIESLTTRLEQEKAAGKQPFGREITSTSPLLAAPLWTDGKATLATFQVSETGLVRHATNEAKVDLSGDLGASFNLHLDHNGSEIFWTAFKNYGQQVPILISYQLKYKARVSAKMTIEAKRSVVHRQLWQHARPFKLLVDRFPRYVPVQASGPLTPQLLSTLQAQLHVPVAAMIERPHIRTALQETITTNAIDVRIETDQAGGGEEEAKVREMMFKVATEVLSDQLIPTLFGAANNTLPGAGSDSDTQPTKQLVEVKEQPVDGTATFKLSLDHQTSIERHVNPNGPIQLALATPDQLARCFSEVRAGDGFFKELRVLVATAGVNFERDGIDKIKVWLLYDEIDEPHVARPRVRREEDGQLTSERDTLKFRPIDLARAANGAHKRRYRYRTKVFYKEGPPTPPEDDNWEVSSDRMLLITAASVGAIRVELVLTAPSIVESARVEMRHHASGRTYETALELTAAANRRTWFEFTGARETGGATPAPPRYSYRVTYRVAGGQIVTPWTDATTELLEIPGPFTRTLTFTVRPGGSLDGVASIAGDIVYEDRAHGYRRDKPFQLVKLTDALVFDVPILEGGPEVTHWQARVTMTDGAHDDLPRQEARPGTIWVGQGGGRNLTVNIITDLIDFDTDVQLAVVGLRYVDTTNGVDVSKSFNFSKAAKAGQSWKVGIRPGAPKTYDVDIQYFAYDRTKSGRVTRRAVEGDTPLILDRAAS